MSENTTESERLFTKEHMDKAFRLGYANHMYYDAEDVEGALENVMGYKSFNDLIEKLLANDNGKDSASGVRVNALVIVLDNFN